MNRKKRRDKVDGYEPKVNTDGYKNELTGIGDFLRDKTRGGREGNLEFQPSFLTNLECAARWRGSDLGARIVETIPDEMTREAWEVSIQPDDEDDKADAFPSEMMPAPKSNPKPLPDLTGAGVDIAEELDGLMESLGAVECLREALCYERGYGGGAIYVGAEDGLDPAKPLNEENIAEVRHLTAFTGGWDGELIASSYYQDKTASNYGKPEVYVLRNIGVPTGSTTGKSSQPNLTAYIHESRLLVFPGTAVSREYRTQMRGWGDPVFTRVEEVLSHYGQTWGGIANLMTDFSQGVLKIKDLAQSMSSNNKGGTRNLTQRAIAMNMARSISKILLIDGEEEFKRDTVSLSGIADLMQQFALRLAAAADMPVALLMGQAPAGLNATGASDIRFFYDRVAAKQRTRLGPQIKKLIRLIFKSKEGPTGGKEPEKWNLRFKSLYQLSELERADLRNRQAQTDKIYVDSGVVTPEEIAASRFGGSEWSAETVIDFEGREKMAEEEAKAKEERAAKQVEAEKRQGEVNEANTAVTGAKAKPPETENPFDHDDEWNEEDHPRAENGQFGEGGAEGDKYGKAGRKSTGQKTLNGKSIAEPKTGDRAEVHAEYHRKLESWYKQMGSQSGAESSAKRAEVFEKIAGKKPTAEPKQTAPKQATEPKASGASGNGKEFSSPGSAESWGDQHYASWAKKLPSDQSGALQSYTAGGFIRMNGALRGTEKDVSGFHRNNIEHLDRALRSAPPMPETVIAFRGVGAEGAYLKKLQGLKPGDALHDKAFVSTSLSKAEASEFSGGVMFHITVPKGTRGAAYVTTSKVKGESELLLSKGRSMTVDRVEKTAQGHVIHVTVAQLGGK